MTHVICCLYNGAAAKAAEALHIRQAVFGLLPPKGGEGMRLTIHIGTFTVTIIVKKRKNRHSAK